MPIHVPVATAEGLILGINFNKVDRNMSVIPS
jgi:hypothetical protein